MFTSISWLPKISTWFVSHHGRKDDIQSRYCHFLISHEPVHLLALKPKGENDGKLIKNGKTRTKSASGSCSCPGCCCSACVCDWISSPIPGATGKPGLQGVVMLCEQIWNVAVWNSTVKISFLKTRWRYQDSFCWLNFQNSVDGLWHASANLGCEGCFGAWDDRYQRRAGITRDASGVGTGRMLRFLCGLVRHRSFRHCGCVALGQPGAHHTFPRIQVWKQKVLIGWQSHGTQSWSEKLWVDPLCFQNPQVHGAIGWIQRGE